jgi:hypothetical protein
MGCTDINWQPPKSGAAAASSGSDGGTTAGAVLSTGTTGANTETGKGTDTGADNDADTTSGTETGGPVLDPPALPFAPGGLTYAGSAPGLAGFLDGMEIQQQAGMNLFGFIANWSDLEPEPGVYDAAEILPPLTIFLPLYPEIDTVHLTLKMIDTGWRPMPQDIKDASFDSEEVLARFDALVDLIASTESIERVSHIYLGNEVDGYLTAHPDQVAPFLLFFIHARDRIHEVMPWMEVGTIVTFGGLERARETFAPLVSASDVVSFTYYPVEDLDLGNNAPQWQMRPVSEVADDLSYLIDVAGSTPFSFTEIGYSAAPENASSEAAQANFVREMFRVLGPAYEAGQLHFLTYSAMYDYPPEFCEPYAGEQGIPASPEFCTFLANLGLRSYETGSARPGWSTFVNEINDLALETKD